MAIQRMTKGEPPSMLQADVANSVIDVANAVERMEIQPAEMGKVVATMGPSGKIVLDLSSAKTTIANEVMQILLDGGEDGGGGGDGVGGLLARIQALEARLNAASITAACGSNGQITVTLSI